MSIREQILETRQQVSFSNYGSAGHAVRLTTVYLGHEEFASFVTDPGNRDVVMQWFGDKRNFMGVEIIEVNKPNHVGYAWADSRVLPS
jgi:hypothetical protein